MPVMEYSTVAEVVRNWSRARSEFLCVFFQRQTALEMLMFFFNNQKKQNQYIYQCKRTLCFAMLLSCK